MKHYTEQSMSWNHNKGVLNFNTGSKMDEYDLPTKKLRPSRDPMSHRIIEKRRRDRMNQCLADLSQLIPPAYLKQGQGRIEKTEIIEMACKYIKQLKMQLKEKDTLRPEHSGFVGMADSLTQLLPYSGGACCQEKFYLGFSECMDEVMRFLVEKKGYNPADNVCVDLMDHLKEHNKKFRPESIPISQQVENGPTEEMSSSMAGVMGEGMVGLPSAPGTPGPDHQTPDYPPMSRDMHGMVAGSGMSTGAPLDGSSSDAGYNTSSVAMQEQHDVELIQDDTSMHSITDSQDMDLATKQGLAGAYKFKNTIKLRFSADAHSPEKGCRNFPPGDSSSVSSREEEGKRKGEKAQSHSPSSDSTSTQYPASDYSSNCNGSSSSTSSNCNSSSIRQGSREQENSAQPNMASQAANALNSAVPGFALHPSGTYYIPIVIAVAHLLPFLRNEPAGSSMGICHPVSIPISFGGPFPSMQNIHIGSGPDAASMIVPKSEPGYSSSNYRRWRNDRENHQ